MTSLERVDTGFAPWSLMTPDPAKARVRDAKTPDEGGSTATVHEDKRAPEVAVGDDYMFGDDGLTFGDFLDMVNPLQHLPVVGAVYRSLTDDQIDPGAQLAGGVLYGGPLGLASAALNNAIEEHTGNDVSGHALAFLGLGGDDAPAADEALDAPIQQAAGPALGAATDTGGAASVLALDPRQAAALERFAARGQGGSQTDAATAGAIAAPASTAVPANANTAAGQPGSIDQLVATDAAAAQNPARRPADFGGVARISDQMARHLAQLAQSDTDPVRSLAAGVQPPLPHAGARPQETAAHSMSPFTGGPMPLNISGEAPAANPFAGMPAAPLAREPAPAKPDPFDVALEQLGLRQPAPAGEQPLIHGQAPFQTQSASLDTVQPPAAEDVPAAMLSALKRYEAMQREG